MNPGQSLIRQYNYNHIIFKVSKKKFGRLNIADTDIRLANNRLANNRLANNRLADKRLADNRTYSVPTFVGNLCDLGNLGNLGNLGDLGNSAVDES